jgi:glycosyltransferase involved in cell wall biosynthesis
MPALRSATAGAPHCPSGVCSRTTRGDVSRSTAIPFRTNMHIVVVNQDFLPETGAGPARISELAAAWLAAGHSVSVLCGFPNRRMPGQRDGVIPAAYRGRAVMTEQLHGVTVHRSWLYTTPRRGFGHVLASYMTFAATAFANALLRMPRPDVLIASGPPYFQQFSGALAARLRGVPLVLEVRDMWPDYLVEMGVVKHPTLTAGLFASEKWLCDQSRAMVVVTESFRQRFVAKGVDAGKITVIPNGVDTSRYYASDETLPLTHGNRETDGPVIGYLGTFGAGQGLLAVIQAARILHERGVRARFLLVGDGSDRAVLAEDLAATPVPGVSIHDPIPRDATRAFYQGCDIVLVPHAPLPILKDTVPSKIFEVMACERPLLAALGGEGARIVERSGGGILAKPGNAESIADGIMQLRAMSPAALQSMGASGRAFATREYDREQLAVRYLSLLERVVAEARAPSAR